MATYSPNWQAEALAQGKDVNSPEYASFRAMDSTQSSPSSINSDEYIRKAIEQQQKAIQPGVDKLNQGITNTGTAYNQYRTTQQNSVQPLQDRYKAILDSIKGNQVAAENRQTAVTNAELAKRGITNSSTLADQEVASALQPITAEYAGLSAQTGLAEQQDVNAINQAIAQSYIGENSDTNALNQAIASLFGNAASTGASVGSNLYGVDTNSALEKARQAQAAISQQLERSKFDFAKSTDERDFNEKVREFGIQQAKSGSSQNDLTALFKQLGIGGQGNGSKADIAAGKAPVPGTSNYVIGRTADGGYVYRDSKTGKTSIGPGGFMG